MGNDITLGGIQYGVVPGSYEKRNRRAGVKASGWERIAVESFPGQHFPFEGGGWDSAGVGPVWNGAGVEPFPGSAVSAGEGLSDTPSSAARAYGLVVGDRLYVGLGRRIYQSASLSAGSWAAFTVLADLGAGFTISGLAYYQDDILVMLSTGQDIRRVSIPAGAVTVWRLGEKGVVGCGYAGQLIYAPGAANASDQLSLSGTKWNGNAVTHTRYLDAPVLSMCNYQGAVAIATRRSLYLMAGQNYPGEADDAAVTADTSKAPLWTEDPQQIMSHGQYVSGDDLTWLVSYRGNLYTWLGSRVVRFDGRAWEPIGPDGVRSYGACVSGDWLVVAMHGRAGEAQLWGYDGAGWWLLYERTGGGLAVWPAATGGAGTWDVVCFRDSSTTTVDLLRLRWRSTSNDTYPAAGAWTSPMLSAGGVARWSHVGAAFAAPGERGNGASGDSVTLSLAYSTDGGQTWVTVDTETAFLPALGRVLELGADVAISARYLQLRVSWSSVADWAPVLERAWADHEPLPIDQPTRRVWELDIEASDKSIRRDGSVDPRTGSQAIASLWDAWEGQRALSFRDIEGSLWTPASLSGLAGWYRAEDLTGLNDGDLVSSWPDAMGGETLVQATVAAMPAFRVGVQNGLPVVRFGGNDWLTLDSILGIGIQPFSQYIIWKPSGAGQAAMLWANNAGLMVTDFDDDVGIFSGSALFNFNAHAFSAWHIVAGVHNGVSGSLAVDGGTAVTGSTGSGSPAGVLTVGAGINGVDRWVTGDIAELLITRTALSADEIAKLFGYGAHKWGLAANLPGGHAYKAAAPRAEATVRIEAIRERVGKPSDRSRWGESVVHLQLDEV